MQSWSTSGPADMDFLQVLANLLALAGICPFVGSLSDLIGRRYVAIIGSSLICIGMIISSTAKTMNVFIAKSVFNTEKYRPELSRLIYLLAKVVWPLRELVLASMS